LQTLRERGFIQDTTDDEALAKILADGADPTTAYIGFDPSADSLHVGHLVQVMALIHVQQSGHRPIAVVGGGTGRIGDPTGKTEMRKVLGGDEIETNIDCLRTQLSGYVDLAPAGSESESPTQGLLINNADWLLALNYVDFLREIGRFFSINRMLTAESVKMRIESESGLSFLEFNYMILQAYDFLVLQQRYGCVLQIGGKDQWGNIVAGIDLIRRVESKPSYGITTPLITTASGNKMGKTEKGAVWLDPKKTSPYDYYQFWINTDDRDVGKFLRLFTLLPIAEIEELEKLEGADIRTAKERLAMAATALTHGDEEAEKSREAAKKLFESGGSDAASVPTHTVGRGALEEGIPVFQIFHESGLCDSRGAARRLAKGGGARVNKEKVADDRILTLDDLNEDGVILLQAGKKKHRRIEVE